MSRSKKFKNTPNAHQNCVTEEKNSIKSSAIKLKKEHDKWEEKESFEVIKVDNKTTVYRRVKYTKLKPKSGSVIHKGRI